MKLVKDTDPILRQPTVDFDFESGIDPEELSKEMAPLMFEHGGIGLAAPQVGLNYNMFLLGDPESAVACFNPRLVSFSEETIYDVEGCLTFPGLFLKIGRPKEIVAEFTDSNGKEQTIINQKTIRLLFILLFNFNNSPMIWFLKIFNLRKFKELIVIIISQYTSFKGYGFLTRKDVLPHLVGLISWKPAADNHSNTSLRSWVEA